MNIEKQLTRIETKIDKLLVIQTPVWITEVEAMKIIGRSRKWLHQERMGTKEIPDTLIEGKDWRRINGKTPEYRATSIARRKNINSLKKPLSALELPTTED